MRVGITGAAHLLKCNTSAVNNWSKLDSFPRPILRGDRWREWAPEELEAWAAANWTNRPALRAWAESKGYVKPTVKPIEGGVAPDDWDTTNLMRKRDIARHLGLRQASGGRVFGRRDFPPPVAVNPSRWDPAVVLAWAQENAHLKSLSGWVGSTRNEIKPFDGYMIHDLAALLGMSTRAIYGLMDKDFDFPLEIAPGGWDRAEVDSWKASHFDLPEYPHKPAS